MADRNLQALKDIVDQICAEEKRCKRDTPMLTHFTKLANTINTMLLNNNVCFDANYNHIDGLLAPISEEIEKNPSLNTFNVKLFSEAYDKWEKQVMADRLTAITMGESAKPLVQKDQIVFDDLTGMDREKDEIKTLFIYPYEYPMLFPNKARGMLLYGPPGTGKTYLVKALANELKNTILFTPSPSEFKGKYEGETEKKITALYAEATNILNGPPRYDTKGKEILPPKAAVIFIDEADSLFSAGREEDSSKQRTVNTFLQVMDGINTDKRIATIAATNYPKSLDEAILRRLPVKIFVNLPTNQMRLNQLIVSLDKRYGEPALQKDFWKNIATYGFKEYKYIKGWTGDSYENTIHYLDYGDEKEIYNKEGKQIGIEVVSGDVIEILKLTTNSEANNIYFENVAAKYQAPDENTYDITSIGNGHANSLSPLGYTLSDLNNALNKAYNMASLRAVNEDAYFFETKHNGKTIYIYSPTYTHIMNTIENQAKIIEKFNSEHKHLGKIVDIEGVKDNSAIVSFDIRLSDIEDALKKTPATAKLETYKQVYSYYKSSDEE